MIIGQVMVAQLSAEKGYVFMMRQPTGQDLFEFFFLCFTINETSVLVLAVDCGTPPDPVNHNSLLPVDVTNTTEGNVAYYDCGYGYSSNSSFLTRECQSNGSWSGDDIVCYQVNCGAPPDSLGGASDKSLTYSNTTYQAEAVYSCGTGYTSRDELTRVCQSDAQWSDVQPQCFIIDCGEPKSQGGASDRVVTYSNTTYQSTAVYSCGTGYTSSDQLTGTCHITGQWSRPRCFRTDSNTRKIKIAFSAYEDGAKKNFRALAYALDKIKSGSEDLSAYDFEIRYVDSDCNGKTSLGVIVNLLEEGYDFNLAVGPVCSPAIYSMGLLTSKLNIATLGYNSALYTVSDKSVYTTLIRGVASTESVVLSAVSVTKEFSWKIICIFSFKNDAYSDSAARDTINTLNAKGREVYWVQNIDKNGNVTDIRKDLRKTKARCRVIIFIYTDYKRDYTRNWTVAAYEEHMHTGEYAFIWFMVHSDAYRYFDEFEDWFDQDNKTQNEILASYKVLESVLLVIPSRYSRIRYALLKRRISNNYWDSVWESEFPLSVRSPGLIACNLYELMRVYTSVVNDIIKEGEEPIDGEQVFQRAKNFALNDTYYGIPLWWTENADRAENYNLYEFVENSSFSIIALSTYSLVDEELTMEYNFTELPVWGDGSTNAPRDEPQCGFFGDKCTSSNQLYIIVAALSISVSVIMALPAAIAVKRKYEIVDWRVDAKDLQVVFGSIKSQASIKTSGIFEDNSASSAGSKSGGVSISEIQRQQAILLYKGLRVMLKPIRKKTLEMSNKILKKIIKLSCLKHNNITHFVGINADPPIIYILWEYCPKGSLQDVIANSFFAELDHVFKFSLATDILKGLQYIHKYLPYHGNLKSSNVVVDSRWTAKLTDFGLEVFTIGQEPNLKLNETNAFEMLYWTAPELLLVEDTSGELITYKNLAPEKWPKCKDGDIYSVGIIFKELFCANAPYTEQYERGFSSKEIIKKLHSNKKYRPSLERMAALKDLSIQNNLKKLICDCWDSDPDNRPPASEVLNTLYTIIPLKKSNIMDKIVNNMRMYTKELEHQVNKNTTELLMEKEHCDRLLEAMLPSSVLKTLHEGRQVEAEVFRSCTLLISGISGFVDVVFKISAEEVIFILNNMHSMLDLIVQCYDVYKVSTIGDIYILASGLPNRNGNKHIANIANCALSLLHAVHSAHQKQLISNTFQLVIGIHTGSIVAGVIGVSAPKYDLFGDNINTASRMMTEGKAMRIQMSLSACEALSIFGGYYIADRGLIAVKGKGEMHTFWLYGKENFPLPSFENQFQSDEEEPILLPVTTQIVDPALVEAIAEPIILEDEVIKSWFVKARHPSISEQKSIDVGDKRKGSEL